jgi:peroxiredoxin
VRGGAALLFAAVLALDLVGMAPGASAASAADTRIRMRSVTGQALDLEQLRQRGPVLLDFWATWCKPCLASLPELEALHRTLGPRGLTVIGISVDGPRNFSKVRPFTQRLGLTFPIVLDEDGGLQQRFQVRAVPTSVLIGADGRVVRVTPGWRPGETAELERAVSALLADSTSSPHP